MSSRTPKAIAMIVLALSLLSLASDGSAQDQCGAGMYPYTFSSFCPFPIWVGQSADKSNGQSYPPQDGHWALAARCTANTECASGTCDQNSGQCTCSSANECSGGACLANGKCATTATFCMPPIWTSGTFWPRTGCTADGTGGLNCETGQCTPASATTGLLDCGVGTTSPAPPVTQFEVTSNAAGLNYDVSLVAGHNVEMKVTPRGGSDVVPARPAGQGGQRGGGLPRYVYAMSESRSAWPQVQEPHRDGCVQQGSGAHHAV